MPCPGGVGDAGDGGVEEADDGEGEVGAQPGGGAAEVVEEDGVRVEEVERGEGVQGPAVVEEEGGGGGGGGEEGGEGAWGEAFEADAGGGAAEVARGLG